jgi:ATP-dependent protease ClpP protease subunit
MVHEIQIEGMGGTHTQTKAFQTELNRMQDECYTLYAEFSYKQDYDAGLKPTPEDFENRVKQWDKLCTKETYFGADKALEYGLIDEIV